MVDSAPNVVPLSPNQAKRKAPQIPGKPAIIQGCRNHLNAFLRDAMMAYSDKAEEALYKKTLTEDARVVSVDMPVLRNIKVEFNSGYREGVLRLFDMFWRGMPIGNLQQGSEPESGELSLVDQDELEESLSIQLLTRKCEEKNFEPLYGLNRRLGFMEGFQELKKEVNPVGPAVLVKMFVEQIKKHNFSSQTKALLFDHFEMYVLDHLAGLYKELNQLLVQGGILPTLPRPGVTPSAYAEKPKSEQKKQSSSPAARRALDEKVDSRSGSGTDAGAQKSFTSGAGSPEGGTGSGSDEVIDAEIYEGLKALASQVRASRPETEFEDGVRICGRTFSSQELLGELTQLQKEDLYGKAVDGESDLADLKKQLNLSLQVDGERRPYLDQDESVIDIVAMFFDVVLEDHHLPDSVRAMIGRLQIPVLKVAMMDRTFFAKKSHPARKLINAFSKAGLGVCEQNTRIRHVVLDKMESMVDQILLEFEDDMALFEDLNAEFGEFMVQQMQQIEIIEERSRKATENNERLELTKRQAAYEIATRLNGKAAPRFVKEFLDNAWKDVLVLALLRQEREPQAVVHGSRIMDQLIASVVVQEDPAQRELSMQGLPRLLKDLRRGLEDISYDPYESAQWFKELEAWHLKVLSQKIPEEVAEIPVLEEVIVEDILDVSERMLSDMPQDKFTRKAMSLEVNDWVEFHNDSDELVRARLSWKSEVTLKCLFVNDRGAKALELTLPELAEKLRAKELKLVGNDKESLFDRAVNSLMNVFNSDSGPTPHPA